MIEGKSLRSDLHHLDRALQALQRAALDAAHAADAADAAAPPWMAPLARLLAEVDEVLDDEEAPSLAVERDLHTRAERLLGPQAPLDPLFRGRYDALRLAHPQVERAHAALLDVMAQLPSHPLP